MTVWLRGGTYYQKETLVFGPQDSGTEDCPITYAAYPGETPVICGGREIAAHVAALPRRHLGLHARRGARGRLGLSASYR